MPLVDMPLAELYKYQGRNPRPDDFDQYWATALLAAAGRLRNERPHNRYFRIYLHPHDFQCRSGAIESGVRGDERTTDCAGIRNVGGELRRAHRL